MASQITENIFEKAYAKDSVFIDRNIISPHYLPKVLPFREYQIKDMTELLSPSLQNKKPNNLFLYGKTGTGKTSVTKHVVEQLFDFAKSKGVGVEGCYINCRMHNSSYRVMIKAAKDFYPDENFLGFSAAFVYEKIVDFARAGRQIILVLDEIDMVKDVDGLVYSLTRANDELESGGISLIGISNNLVFKERLSPRTKSSLCEHEMVFPPYNAEELYEILKQRVDKAFRKNAVDDSALSLAAAYAAQESGDARTAVMLLLHAGELADKKHLEKIAENEVKKAKNKVEEELIYNMVSSLPRQQQLVLYAISDLTLQKKPVRTIMGELEHGVLYSGEVYDQYCLFAKKLRENLISARWYRAYISELEMYGLITTRSSGKGVKGQTRFIKLASDPKKMHSLMGKEFEA